VSRSINRSAAKLLPVLQTAADHRQLTAAGRAGFLLDQVVLDAAHTFGGIEDLRPRSGAFAERDVVAGGRRPILAMHALDAAWIRLDPRDRIGTHFETRADVELQDDVFRCARGENVHRALAIDRTPFDLMVVVSGAHSERLQLLGDGGQLIADRLPPVDAIRARRARHDDVRAPDDLIQFDRLLQTVWRE